MGNISTIERLPNESDRAFRARVEYVTMGPDRSLQKVRQKIGKSAAYIRQLEEWSSQYGWTTTAQGWDDQQAAALVALASEKYRADLEAHRKKAMDAGQGLYAVAGQLLQQVNTAIKQPRQIRGEDGRLYTLHGIEMNANTLQIVSRALQTALDLEAHALGVDRVLQEDAPAD